MSPALIATTLTALAMWWSAAPGPRFADGGPPARRRRPRRPDPVEIARLCERLATVIAGGCAPRRAWDAVAETLAHEELRAFARAVAAGADARTAARGPLATSAQVRSLTVALAVCERTGAPAVAVLSGLAESLRDLHDAAMARTSAFAGPRSTARILLALPFAGLGLGILLGADPISFLLGSSAGRLVGSLGCGLTAWGWWWMHRMLRAADPPDRGSVDPSVVLELTAGVLRGGLPLSRAVQAVARALAPSATQTRTGQGAAADAAALERFGAALAAGVPARVAAAALPPQLAALRDCAELSAGSGADLVRVLMAAAHDSRRGRARAAEATAARLAVRLVLPTGLALLPAFVALGIVPTVASLVGGSFSAGLLGGP